MITSVYGGRATIVFNEGNHAYYVNVPDAGIRRLYQPSVTGILGMKDKSKALVPWAVGAMYDRTMEILATLPNPVDKKFVEAALDCAQDSHRAKKTEAASVGSLAHRALEQILKHRAGECEMPRLPLTPDSLLAPNLTPEMVEMANLSVKAGIKFFDDHHLIVLQSEVPRWSPTYGYVGTGDLIAKLDGVLSVLDFKTGKRPYAEYFLQTAAYQHAYQEEFPDQRIEARWIVNVGRDGELQTAKRDNETFDIDFGAFLALNTVYRWHSENQMDYATGRDYSKPAPRVLGSLDKLLSPKVEGKNQQETKN